ncbi:hypothetical protein BDV93DRAFT_562322 [Ceratobasidium sp. AG-I]|nr:hypothetical protein BDV93DRAFT_562322 [Ceratobasidium sp. AG-I]
MPTWLAVSSGTNTITVGFLAEPGAGSVVIVRWLMLVHALDACNFTFTHLHWAIPIHYSLKQPHYLTLIFSPTVPTTLSAAWTPPPMLSDVAKRPPPPPESETSANAETSGAADAAESAAVAPQLNKPIVMPLSAAGPSRAPAPVNHALSPDAASFSENDPGPRIISITKKRIPIPNTDRTLRKRKPAV